VIVATEMADWTPTIGIDELIDGKAQRVQAFGIDVLLLKNGDLVFAIANRCTHQGAPLDRGVTKLPDATVTCPAHGSVFSLEDGRVRRGPATQPVASFDVRLNEGSVELRPRA
jgi:nitrite reductase/ring-hydroxylating ferredoxin subunit